MNPHICVIDNSSLKELKSYCSFKRESLGKIPSAYVLMLLSKQNVEKSANVTFLSAHLSSLYQSQ